MVAHCNRDGHRSARGSSIAVCISSFILHPSSFILLSSSFLFPFIPHPSLPRPDEGQATELADRYVAESVASLRLKAQIDLFDRQQRRLLESPPANPAEKRRIEELLQTPSPSREALLDALAERVGRGAGALGQAAAVAARGRCAANRLAIDPHGNQSRAVPALSGQGEPPRRRPGSLVIERR